MTTPQQQIIDKSKECFAKAKHLFGLDLSKVAIRFDLKGRAAGMAGMRGGVYYTRYNNDMLTREAFDHVLNATVPHEVAHIVCFMNRAFGSNHNAGWARVCKALGGTGETRHTEDVVHGKGATYEYTTSTGNTVRVGDKYHNMVQSGRPLTYRKGLGTISKECAYTIVGVNGRSLTTPIVRVPVAKEVIVQAVTPPIVAVARTSYTIGVPPVARTSVMAFAAGTSKASIARAIMLAGHTRGQTYEQIITAIMSATGHDRQLSRATYKANHLKVGCPAM